jgi:predicted transcriptional regulator
MVRGGNYVSQKPITPLGWKIIEKLAEKKLTRKQFCEQEGIPESRLSNLITGIRPAKKYREIVIKALEIED